MAEGWEPFGITTEAGKKLFIYMNMHYGSGVWGRVGEGVVEVEKEVIERIIALLEPYVTAECDEWCEWSCECFAKYEAEHFIKLIKGEN